MIYFGTILSREIKKFFDPVIRRPWIIAWILAVSVFLTIGLAELARRNSVEAALLAAEALSEVGPDFSEASREHGEMLRKYVEHSEKRRFSYLMNLLYPQYSPKKQLGPIVSALQESQDDEEEAKKVIRQAGESINEFRADVEEFCRGSLNWPKSEKLPGELRRDIERALADSREQVRRLEKDRLPQNAMAACSANRKTMLLLFLGRMGYRDGVKIGQFSSDLEHAYRYTMDVAMRTQDPEMKEVLNEDARGQLRRMEILQAMLGDNMDKVSKVLSEAIEGAYEKQIGSEVERPP